MANLNTVLLMGHLTRDVESRKAGDSEVHAFGLAINRRYKTASGEEREEVTFIDCESWGKVGETIGKHLHKGDPIYVGGRLKLDTWEKDGQKQSKLKVVVENFQFIGGKKDQAGAKPGTARPAAPARTVAEEDIPF